MMDSSNSSADPGRSNHQQPAAPPPQQPHLPPGFRFHPTDEELVVHYLKRRTQSVPLPVSIIAEVDLYKFDPWELPAMAVFGEQEWYFFSPRDRKYPNGARPNRAATSGYWKATGTDKPIMSTAGNHQKVGVKKALVFYGGKPPRGIKTNWIMHEYRLIENKPNNKPPGYDTCHNRKASLRLDDWVLCRIYKKSNGQKPMEQEREDSLEDMMMMSTMSSMSMGLPNLQGSIHNPNQVFTTKPITTDLNYNSLLDHQHQGMYTDGMNHTSLSDQIPPPGLPLKRAVPSLYWPSDDQESLSLRKKPHNNEESGHQSKNDHNNDDDNNNNNMDSIASMLNQVPNQTTSLNQQPMLGGLQSYPFPGLNWYT